MNHEQIETFLAVVHNGSFCQAAKALYMSQPAVTHRIKTLETELGAQLFVRTKKGVTLTRAGEYLYEEAQAFIEKSREIREQVKKLQDEGVQIVTDIDKALWLEAVQPLYDQYRDVIGADLLQRIQDAMAS